MGPVYECIDLKYKGKYVYTWAFLVAQTGKNLPAMQETQVQSLSWEDPLEKEMATLSSVLIGKTHGQRSLI